MNRHRIEFRITGTFVIEVEAPKNESEDQIYQFAEQELWDIIDEMATNCTLSDAVEVEEVDHIVEPM